MPTAGGEASTVSGSAKQTPTNKERERKKREGRGTTTKNDLVLRDKALEEAHRHVEAHVQLAHHHKRHG